MAPPLQVTNVKDNRMESRCSCLGLSVTFQVRSRRPPFFVLVRCPGRFDLVRILRSFCQSNYIAVASRNQNAGTISRCLSDYVLLHRVCFGRYLEHPRGLGWPESWTRRIFHYCDHWIVRRFLFGSIIDLPRCGTAAVDARQPFEKGLGSVY